MMELGFLCEKNILARLEQKTTFVLICLLMKTNRLFESTFHSKKFGNSMNLLHAIDEKQSNYVYIKNSDRFLFHKTNNKNKKYIFQGYLECFNRKNLLTDHKQISLSVNGTQSERLEKVTTEFKNYFQQIPVLFKVYADFECNLESVESYEVSYSKKYQDHIPCSFSSKLVCVDDKFTKAIVVFRGENAAYEFIKPILKEYEYCKTVMKKHFNKDLIMSEEEEQFQSSNIRWICKRLINDHNEKVWDYCHISGNLRFTSL